MNIGSLRKRLARLEKIARAQIEDAALSIPTREPSREERDRTTLGILGLIPSSRRTAEDKAEIECLGALYPDELERLRASDAESENKSLDELLQETIQLIENEKLRN